MATAEKDGAADCGLCPSPEIPKPDGPGLRKGVASAAAGRQSQRTKRCGLKGKRRLQKGKRRGQEEKAGVTVKRAASGGKRHWDKKHYCLFCRRPQVKIARHLLRKHADEWEVLEASVLPVGSKERHLLLEQLRCRGNYQHNVEVIRQGSGEIVPGRRPSQEVDARNYLPCPGCLGFFLRADLWRHQVSCRRKTGADPSEDLIGPTAEPSKANSSEPTGEGGAKSPEDAGLRPSDETSRSQQPVAPRKRRRVQAAASRLLPISDGASESCSEILHRMNQDQVSHQVKSDWLICKYGNTLMGNQDSSQMGYDHVSQKLRSLGRFLLAAKSLDSGIRTLQDLLAPENLSLALAAARKACGYRQSCLPLSLKTTLKAVCDIAVGESLRNGDGETAAKTSDFYHLLGRDWNNLRLPAPKPDQEENPGERSTQSRGKKKSQDKGLADGNSGHPLLILSKSSIASMESPLQLPVTVPAPPKKVHRRLWSSAEKEAIWRQLGVHVLAQTVPGKEICERCLDLEPVLRGRHWKDIKNQVHNQIQSKKKQQFHAQMELLENPVQQEMAQDQKKQQQRQRNRQPKDHTQSLKKQQCPTQLDLVEQTSNHVKNKCQAQVDTQDQDRIINKPQYQAQMEHLDHTQLHKKQQYQARLEYQEPIQFHKKHLYSVDQQNQGLQMNTLALSDSPFRPDGTHLHPAPLVDRDSALSPYELGRTSGPHVEQMLSGAAWADDHLSQNYHVSRPLARNLLQEADSATATSHSGHVRY